MFIYFPSPYEKHRLVRGKLLEVRYIFNRAFPWDIKIRCLESIGGVKPGDTITSVNPWSLRFTRIK
jgi:hypothetical protein